MRILVTGGLGVNGCWVTRQLLDWGHQPVVYDRRPDFTLLRDVQDQIVFVPGDIMDATALQAVCQENQIDRICHLAAIYPEAADADPLMGFNVNALSTVNVLEAARVCNIDRVVFTSSIGALAEMTPEHLYPEYKPVGEDYPVYPPAGGVYGAAKVASEMMGIQYNRLFGIEFAALRFAAIYGLGKKAARHGNTNTIWADMVDNALLGRPTVIEKGGDELLDMTYSRDVAHSVVLAVTAPKIESHVYHIGSGTSYTIRQYADAIRQAVPGAVIDVGGGRDPRGHGPRAYYRMDISLARKELGYEPQFDPSAAIKDWVSWVERLELEPGATY